MFLWVASRWLVGFGILGWVTVVVNEFLGLEERTETWLNDF